MALITVNTAAPSREELSQLITLIASEHDRQAFAALFKHFAPRLKSYLMRLSMPPNTAEEIVQETMLMVWRKASYFDPSLANASTWIFTIARNLRIDYLRRDNRQKITAIDPSEEVDPPMSGEDQMLSAERDEKIKAALSKLSQEQLTIVQLSFFSDKPHSEIAQELNIPLGTVKSRVRLALAHLRNLMGEAP